MVRHHPKNYRSMMLHTISTLEVFRHYILKFFPTMSQSKSSTDPHYRKTASLVKAHPTLKLPSAMYLARFTEEECHDQISPTTTSSSASEESLEKQREKEGEQWHILKGTH
jgi:hypothetical protein